MYSELSQSIQFVPFSFSLVRSGYLLALPQHPYGVFKHSNGDGVGSGVVAGVGGTGVGRGVGAGVGKGVGTGVGGTGVGVSGG